MTLGKNWIYSFKKRNPGVQAILAERIDLPRLKASEPGRLKAFMDLYGHVIKTLRLDADAIWNVDEIGVILNDTKRRQVVYTSTDAPVVFTKQPTNRQSVTAIECVSASGERISPHVIFKSAAQTLPASRTEVHYGTRYTIHGTTKAWTNQELFFRWLRDSFIPQSGGTGKRRVLLLDGASPHGREDAAYLARSAGVHLIWLPAHTSHMTQPLDVAVFSPLKTAYRRSLGLLQRTTEAETVTRDMFLQCYAEARDRAITRQNCRAGFAATGLWPFNASKILRNRFVLAAASSGHATRSSSDAPAVETPPIALPSTPSSSRSRSIYRQLVDASPSAHRSTRSLLSKLRRTVESDASIGLLGVAIREQDLREREREAYVLRLEREVQDYRASAEALRQVGRRSRPVVDPNARPHGVLDARYVLGETTFAGEDCESYDDALTAISLRQGR